MNTETNVNVDPADEFLADACASRENIIAQNSGARYLTPKPEWDTFWYFESKFLPAYIRAYIRILRPIVRPPFKSRLSLHYRPSACEIRWLIHDAKAWPTSALHSGSDGESSGDLPCRWEFTDEDLKHPIQWEVFLRESELHVVWEGVRHRVAYDNEYLEMSDPYFIFPRGMPTEAVEIVLDVLRRIAAAKTPELLFALHEAGERCGICARRLRDALSRAAGIGPDCAGKLGWNQHRIAEARLSVWK
jgi:Family of unknown function (DUF6011)